MQLLKRKPPSKSRQRIIQGEEEAHLIALTCGDPPEGHSRWTLRLLSNAMIKLEYVDAVSHETIRTVLKKTNLSLGKKKSGHTSKSQRGVCVPNGRSVRHI